MSKRVRNHDGQARDGVCRIRQRTESGDFVLEYNAGFTVNIDYGTEDWLDLDDFLRSMSPSGAYQLEELPSIDDMTIKFDPTALEVR